MLLNKKLIAENHITNTTGRLTVIQLTEKGKALVLSSKHS
jgi:hypothetical protein